MILLEEEERRRREVKPEKASYWGEKAMREWSRKIREKTVKLARERR